MIWDLDRIEQKQSCWKHKWNSVILKRVEIKQRLKDSTQPKLSQNVRYSLWICSLIRDLKIRMFEKSEFPELS